MDERSMGSICKLKAICLWEGEVSRLTHRD